MTIKKKKTNLSEPDAQKVAYHFAPGSRVPESFDVITNVDFAEEIDTLQDRILEKIQNGEPIDEVINSLISDVTEDVRRETLQEMLVKILMMISDSPKPKLTIDLLMVASGMPMEISYTKLADKHGVTKQVFSKKLQNLLKQLNLNRPRASKREETNESYRASNCRKYKFD